MIDGQEVREPQRSVRPRVPTQHNARRRHRSKSHWHHVRELQHSVQPRQSPVQIPVVSSSKESLEVPLEPPAKYSPQSRRNQPGTPADTRNTTSNTRAPRAASDRLLQAHFTGAPSPLKANLPYSPPLRLRHATRAHLQTALEQIEVLIKRLN